MKRIIVALSIVALGFTAASCAAATEGGGDDGGKNGKNSKKGKAAKPDMKVQAVAIMKEYEENEAAADGKYKGKTLQVSGVIDKIDTEFLDDEEYVINIGGGTEYEFFTVNCDDQPSKVVSSMNKGQNITVVGDFEDGGDLGVELKNCVVK